MHSNPFSPIGYDLNDIKAQLARKANEHELPQIRSDVASLERTVGELRTENDGLRSRVERLESAVLELNPGLNW
jgi:septal ring factor EnvC (AmiA/AmiB activator)